MSTVDKPAGRFWRVLRLGAVLMLMLIGLVALGPTIASYDPTRGWIVSLAARDVDGSVRVESASFGWISAQQVNGLAAETSGGKPLFSVQSIGLDRSLLNLVLWSDNLGTISVEAPHVQFLLDNGVSNFAAAFKKLASKPKSDAPPGEGLRGRSVKLSVRDGQVSWQMAADAPMWKVDQLSFVARITPDENGDPVLTIDPGLLLDRYELSEGLCNDVLKYAVPVMAQNKLAKNTRVRGKVSIRLDRFNLPLGHPERMEMAGELALHSVELGAGPISQAFAAFFGLPDMIKLANESVIHFAAQDGYVVHDGVDFGIGPLRVRTSGTVGLKDQSLDLLAQVVLDMGAADLSSRPILSAIAAHPLPVKITGTLAAPKIDAGNLGQQGLSMFMAALQNFRAGTNEAAAEPGAIGKLLQQLTKPQDPSQPSQLGPAAAEAAWDILGQLRDRRRQRQEAQKQPAGAAEMPMPGENSESGTTPPPKRRLGNLLDRFRQPSEPKPPEEPAGLKNP